jgi:hypothetical protein
MSSSSKARSVKRPSPNARLDVKRQAAAKGTVVTALGSVVPAPFNATPGHRDLGLIRRTR